MRTQQDLKLLTPYFQTIFNQGRSSALLSQGVMRCILQAYSAHRHHLNFSDYLFHTQHGTLPTLETEKPEHFRFLSETVLPRVRQYLVDQGATFQSLLQDRTYPEHCRLALFLQAEQHNQAGSFTGCDFDFCTRSQTLAKTILEDQDLFLAITRDNPFGGLNLIRLGIKALGYDPSSRLTDDFRRLLQYEDASRLALVFAFLLKRTKNPRLLRIIQQSLLTTQNRVFLQLVVRSGRDECDAWLQELMSRTNLHNSLLFDLVADYPQGLSRWVLNFPLDPERIARFRRRLTNDTARGQFDETVLTLLDTPDVVHQIIANQPLFWLITRHGHAGAGRLSDRLFRAVCPEQDQNISVTMKLLALLQHGDVPLFVKDTLILRLADPAVIRSVLLVDSAQEMSAGQVAEARHRVEPVIFRNWPNQAVLDHIARVLGEDPNSGEILEGFLGRVAACRSRVNVQGALIEQALLQDPTALSTLCTLQARYRWRRQNRQTQEARWADYTIHEQAANNWKALFHRLRTLEGMPQRFKQALRIERGDGANGEVSHFLTERELAFFRALQERDFIVQHGTNAMEQVLGSRAILSVLQRVLLKQEFDDDPVSHTPKDIGYHGCTFNGYKSGGQSRSALYRQWDMVETNLTRRFKRDPDEALLWCASATPVCYKQGIQLQRVTFAAKTDDQMVFQVVYSATQRKEVYTYSDGTSHEFVLARGSEVVVGGDLIMPFRFLRFIEQLRMMVPTIRSNYLDRYANDRQINRFLPTFTRVRGFEIYRLAQQAITTDTVVIPSLAKCDDIITAIQNDEPIPHIDINDCPIDLLNSAYFQGRTLLYIAVQTQNLTLAKQILSRDNVNVFALTELGYQDKGVVPEKTVFYAVMMLDSSDRSPFHSLLHDYLFHQVQNPVFVMTHYKVLLQAAWTLVGGVSGSPLVEEIVRAFKQLIAHDPTAGFGAKQLVVLMSFLRENQGRWILDDPMIVEHLHNAFQEPVFVKQHYEIIRQGLLQLNRSNLSTKTLAIRFIETVFEVPSLRCFRLHRLGDISCDVAEVLCSTEERVRRLFTFMTDPIEVISLVENALHVSGNKKLDFTTRLIALLFLDLHSPRVCDLKSIIYERFKDDAIKRVLIHRDLPGDYSPVLFDEKVTPDDAENTAEIICSSRKGNAALRALTLPHFTDKLSPTCFERLAQCALADRKTRYDEVIANRLLRDPTLLALREEDAPRERLEWIFHCLRAAGVGLLSAVDLRNPDDVLDVLLSMPGIPQPALAFLAEPIQYLIVYWAVVAGAECESDDNAVAQQRLSAILQVLDRSDLPVERKALLFSKTRYQTLIDRVLREERLGVEAILPAGAGGCSDVESQSTAYSSDDETSEDFPALLIEVAQWAFYHNEDALLAILLPHCKQSPLISSTGQWCNQHYEQALEAFTNPIRFQALGGVECTYLKPLYRLAVFSLEGTQIEQLTQVIASLPITTMCELFEYEGKELFTADFILQNFKIVLRCLFLESTREIPDEEKCDVLEDRVKTILKRLPDLGYRLLFESPEFMQTVREPAHWKALAPCLIAVCKILEDYHHKPNTPYFQLMELLTRIPDELYFTDAVNDEIDVSKAIVYAMKHKLTHALVPEEQAEIAVVLLKIFYAEGETAWFFNVGGGAPSFFSKAFTQRVLEEPALLRMALSHVPDDQQRRRLLELTNRAGYTRLDPKSRYHKAVFSHSLSEATAATGFLSSVFCNTAVSPRVVLTTKPIFDAYDEKNQEAFKRHSGEFLKHVTRYHKPYQNLFRSIVNGNQAKTVRRYLRRCKTEENDFYQLLDFKLYTREGERTLSLLQIATFYQRHDLVRVLLEADVEMKANDLIVAVVYAFKHNLRECILELLPHCVDVFPALAHFPTATLAKTEINRVAPNAIFDEADCTVSLLKLATWCRDAEVVQQLLAHPPHDSLPEVVAMVDCAIRQHDLRTLTVLLSHLERQPGFEPKNVLSIAPKTLAAMSPAQAYALLITPSCLRCFGERDLGALFTSALEADPWPREVFLAVVATLPTRVMQASFSACHTLGACRMLWHGLLDLLEDPGSDPELSERLQSLVAETLQHEHRGKLASTLLFYSPELMQRVRSEAHWVVLRPLIQILCREQLARLTRVFPAHHQLMNLIAQWPETQYAVFALDVVAATEHVLGSPQLCRDLDHLGRLAKIFQTLDQIDRLIRTIPTEEFRNFVYDVPDGLTLLMPAESSAQHSYLSRLIKLAIKMGYVRAELTYEDHPVAAIAALFAVDNPTPECELLIEKATLKIPAMIQQCAQDAQADDERAKGLLTQTLALLKRPNLSPRLRVILLESLDSDAVMRILLANPALVTEHVLVPSFPDALSARYAQAIIEQPHPRVVLLCLQDPHFVEIISQDTAQHRALMLAALSACTTEDVRHAIDADLTVMKAYLEQCLAIPQIRSVLPTFDLLSAVLHGETEQVLARLSPSTGWQVAIPGTNQLLSLLKLAASCQHVLVLQALLTRYAAADQAEIVALSVQTAQSPESEAVFNCLIESLTFETLQTVCQRSGVEVYKVLLKRLHLALSCEPVDEDHVNQCRALLQDVTKDGRILSAVLCDRAFMQTLGEVDPQDLVSIFTNISTFYAEAQTPLDEATYYGLLRFLQSHFPETVEPAIVEALVSLAPAQLTFPGNNEDLPSAVLLFKFFYHAGRVEDFIVRINQFFMQGPLGTTLFENEMLFLMSLQGCEYRGAVIERISKLADLQGRLRQVSRGESLQEKLQVLCDSKPTLPQHVLVKLLTNLSGDTLFPLLFEEETAKAPVQALYESADPAFIAHLVELILQARKGLYATALLAKPAILEKLNEADRAALHAMTTHQLIESVDWQSKGREAAGSDEAQQDMVKRFLAFVDHGADLAGEIAHTVNTQQDAYPVNTLIDLAALQPLEIFQTVLGRVLQTCPESITWNTFTLATLSRTPENLLALRESYHGGWQSTFENVFNPLPSPYQERLLAQDFTRDRAVFQCPREYTLWVLIHLHGSKAMQEDMQQVLAGQDIAPQHLAQAALGAFHRGDYDGMQKWFDQGAAVVWQNEAVGGLKNKQAYSLVIRPTLLQRFPQAAWVSLFEKAYRGYSELKRTAPNRQTSHAYRDDLFSAFKSYPQILSPTIAQIVNEFDSGDGLLQSPDDDTVKYSLLLLVQAGTDLSERFDQIFLDIGRRKADVVIHYFRLLHSVGFNFSEKHFHIFYTVKSEQVKSALARYFLEEASIGAGYYLEESSYATHSMNLCTLARLAGFGDPSKTAKDQFPHYLFSLLADPDFPAHCKAELYRCNQFVPLKFGLGHFDDFKEYTFEVTTVSTAFGIYKSTPSNFETLVNGLENLDTPSPQGITAFHAFVMRICQSGNDSPYYSEGPLACLAQRGVDFNRPIPYGERGETLTALELAFIKNKFNLLSVLLENGAQWCVSYNACVHNALKQVHVRVQKILLTHVMKRRDLKAFLQLAVCMGYGNQRDPVRDECSYTACLFSLLLDARFPKQYKAHLYSFKADCGLRFTLGDHELEIPITSPQLWVASFLGQGELTWLQDQGRDLCERSPEGFTALQAAVVRACARPQDADLVSIVAYLVQQGANGGEPFPSDEVIPSISPATFARHQQCDFIARALLKIPVEASEHAARVYRCLQAIDQRIQTLTETLCGLEEENGRYNECQRRLTELTRLRQRLESKLIQRRDVGSVLRAALGQGFWERPTRDLLENALPPPDVTAEPEVLVVSVAK